VATDFAAITDDFESDLDAIRSMIDAFDDPSKGLPKVRVSAANAATLLLAATFEEFVRSMARAVARKVVQTASSFSQLPSKLATTAWRRTMRSMTQLRIDNRNRFLSSDGGTSDPRSRFDGIYEFCKGDLSQDIYSDLVFNEHNMRPREINSLFGISGLPDVCRQASGEEPLFEHFNEDDKGRSHGLLLSVLDRFFDRRNAIAHSLNALQSSSADLIRYDIATFRAFGRSLCETVERYTS